MKNNTITYTPYGKEQLKLLKKLTFGYEIEGLFNNSVREEIIRELRDPKTNLGQYSRNIGFKYDGSVHDLDTRHFSEMAHTGNSDGEERCENCSGDGGYTNDCNCWDYENFDLTCEIEESHEHDEECYNRNEVLTCEIPENHEHEYDESCYTTHCQDEDDYHWEECEDCGGSGYYDSDSRSTATEYASPIFSDFDSVLNHLAKFNENTHIFNDSCGLHFHIGTKNETDWIKLWRAVASYKLIGQLEDEAMDYCSCQAERTRNQRNPEYRRTRFARKQDSSIEFIADFQRSEKYRFVRFHRDLHTLEFRFLAPCYHKVENIKRLMSSLLKYLTTKQEAHAVGEAETESPEAKQVIEITQTPRTEKQLKKEEDKQAGLFYELTKHRLRFTDKPYEALGKKVQAKVDYEILRNISQDSLLFTILDRFDPVAINNFVEHLEHNGYGLFRKPNRNGDYVYRVEPVEAPAQRGKWRLKQPHIKQQTNPDRVAINGNIDMERYYNDFTEMALEYMNVDEANYTRATSLTEEAMLRSVRQWRSDSSN